MAKDPAFLFYPNDWIGGTMILSRHQKGCYMDLLVAQFNNGPLSLDTIKAVLGQDQAVWTVLSKKFKQTDEGLWYNEKLETVKQKRGEFIKKQSDNGKKGGRKPTLNPTLKPNATNIENENRNKIVNVNSFGKFENLLTEIEIGSTVEFVSITANKTLKTKEVEDYWTAFGIHSEKLNYSGRGDKLQHFRSWLKIQIQTNGTHQQTSGSSKPGTADRQNDAATKW